MASNVREAENALKGVLGIDVGRSSPINIGGEITTGEATAAAEKKGKKKKKKKKSTLQQTHPSHRSDDRHHSRRNARSMKNGVKEYNDESLKNGRTNRRNSSAPKNRSNGQKSYKRNGVAENRGSSKAEEGGNYAWSAFQSSPDPSSLPLPAFGVSPSGDDVVGNVGAKSPSRTSENSPIRSGDVVPEEEEGETQEGSSSQSLSEMLLTSLQSQNFKNDSSESPEKDEDEKRTLQISASDLLASLQRNPMETTPETVSSQILKGTDSESASSSLLATLWRGPSNGKSESGTRPPVFVTAEDLEAEVIAKAEKAREMSEVEAKLASMIGLGGTEKKDTVTEEPLDEPLASESESGNSSVSNVSGCDRPPSPPGLCPKRGGSVSKAVDKPSGGINLAALTTPTKKEMASKLQSSGSLSTQKDSTPDLLQEPIQLPLIKQEQPEQQTKTQQQPPKQQTQQQPLDPLATLMQGQQFMQQQQRFITQQHPSVLGMIPSQGLRGFQQQIPYQSGVNGPIPQPPQGFVTMQIQVPPALLPGRQMVVQNPMGYPVPVTVPEGVSPGMVIPVMVPGGIPPQQLSGDPHMGHLPHPHGTMRQRQMPPPPPQNSPAVSSPQHLMYPQQGGVPPPLPYPGGPMGRPGGQINNQQVMYQQQSQRQHQHQQRRNRSTNDHKKGRQQHSRDGIPKSNPNTLGKQQPKPTGPPPGSWAALAAAPASSSNSSGNSRSVSGSTSTGGGLLK